MWLNKWRIPKHARIEQQARKGCESASLNLGKAKARTLKEYEKYIYYNVIEVDT